MGLQNQVDDRHVYFVRSGKKTSYEKSRVKFQHIDNLILVPNELLVRVKFFLISKHSKDNAG